MELSIVIARILALTYLAAGAAAVAGKLRYETMVAEFERSPALTYVSGFFTLVCGVLLVSYHNIWAGDWRVLVTIVGWMSLLKGVMLIGCPQYLKFFKGWYKNTRAWGLLMLALGALFGYFALFG
jgi:hypothetical protein